MKVYLWKRSGYSNHDDNLTPEWVEQTLIPDIPFHKGYPYYVTQPPVNSLVNFKFDSSTKEISVNWMTLPMVITKDVILKPHDDIDKEEKEKERRYITMKRNYRTIEGALYYSILNKEGISCIAVVE